MAVHAPRLIGLLALALILSGISVGAPAGPAAGAGAAADKVSQGVALVDAGKADAGTPLLKQAVTELLEALKANPKDAKALVLLGTAYTRLNRTDDALPLFVRAAQADPTSAEAFYGAGWVLHRKGQAKTALEKFQAAAKLDPKDWRVHAKLVQLYQAAGNTASRDAERTALLDLREKGGDPGLATVPRYCREQFTVGRRKVMAYEYFNMKNPGGVRYAFHVLEEKAARTELRVNLASDETVNAVAREQGEIDKAGRLYQLYALSPDGGQKLYESYKAEPSYDEARKQCVQIASGKATPASEVKAGQKGDTIVIGPELKKVDLTATVVAVNKDANEKKEGPVDLDREGLTDP